MGGTPMLRCTLIFPYRELSSLADERNCRTGRAPMVQELLPYLPQVATPNAAALCVIAMVAGALLWVCGAVWSRGILTLMAGGGGGGGGGAVSPGGDWAGEPEGGWGAGGGGGGRGGG